MIYVSTTLSVTPYYLHGITITVTLITFECNIILHIPVQQSMLTGYFIAMCIIVMICCDHLALKKFEGQIDLFANRPTLNIHYFSTDD